MQISYNSIFDCPIHILLGGVLWNLSELDDNYIDKFNVYLASRRIMSNKYMYPCSRNHVSIEKKMFSFVFELHLHWKKQQIMIFLYYT
jgi:hypothetical protein